MAVLCTAASTMLGSKEVLSTSVLKMPCQLLYPRKSSFIIRCDKSQNADLPRYYSNKEKKPFPVPILELRRAARERAKKSKGQPRKPLPPPKNGLLIRNLIPVAYQVLNARTTLINNLRKLMKVVPTHACKHCTEIHVGPIGHPFRNCRGSRSEVRRGEHDWTTANVYDIIIAVDAFHLYDRLGKRLTHEERFTTPRLPAVIELCIQAGVELPDFPTKRRRKPIIRIGKNEYIDANEDELPDPEPPSPLVEIIKEDLTNPIPPSDSAATCILAEETLEAWTIMREGSHRLMSKYPVRVCGYCPEVHIGASGHKAQNCSTHKHQQRNGQHGWQKAILNDLIPPRYVWHVPDVNGPPLQRELKSFYGQAPAVVEICIQAGANVPEEYRSTMRLDIGIPKDTREAEMVI